MHFRIDESNKMSSFLHHPENKFIDTARLIRVAGVAVVLVVVFNCFCFF